jgi:hypothetical protein
MDTTVIKPKVSRTEYHVDDSVFHYYYDIEGAPWIPQRVWAHHEVPEHMERIIKRVLKEETTLVSKNTKVTLKPSILYVTILTRVEMNPFTGEEEAKYHALVHTAWKNEKEETIHVECDEFVLEDDHHDDHHQFIQRLHDKMEVRECDLTKEYHDIHHAPANGPTSQSW